MKALRRIIAFTSACVLLSSCGNTQYEYSSRACYFVFDNSTHQDPTLSTAMKANSKGIFCYVTKTVLNGATYLVFSNNNGSSSKSIANAIDLKRSIILGMNNGLIVGYGNLSDPATFYAYDSQCPNCFDPDALPVKNYLLKMGSNGIATCPTCKREYDMNNGGNISKGDSGNKMTRYRTSTTGPLGVLFVN